jgi:hypothetical protein
MVSVKAELRALSDFWGIRDEDFGGTSASDCFFEDELKGETEGHLIASFTTEGTKLSDRFSSAPVQDSAIRELSVSLDPEHFN